MSKLESLLPMGMPAILEALLFVSAEPVSLSQLAVVLELPASEVEKGLKQLECDLATRGLRVQNHAGRFQLTTASETSEIIERFLGLEATSRLSRAALETLAIVAYQQPVTRPYIEGIRGVSSDGVIKSILGKGLIVEVGRSEGPGRPILYGTTPDFLQHFGLNSLGEMPSLSLPDLPDENGHDQALKG
jgi:segregation and condensation protein B